MEMFLEKCQLEDNVLGIVPDIPNWGPEYKPTADVISQGDIDIRECKSLPSHCINSKTGLVNSAVEKIKSGELNGDINKPIIDPAIIIPYDDFWAGDLKSTGKMSINIGIKNVSVLKFTPFIIIYIILVYMIWHKFF